MPKNRGKMQELLLDLLPGASGDFVARPDADKREIVLRLLRDDTHTKVYVDSFNHLVVEVS